MINRNSIVCLLVCLLATGCATTANYKHMLNNWQGANATTLMKTWGYPDGAVKLPDGNTVYMYVHKRDFMQPPSPIVAPVIINASGTPAAVTTYNGMFIGGRTEHLFCRTWFEVNPKGEIVNSRFQGNDCISNDPQNFKP